MSYNPTNWQNLPDTTTPVIAQKLNNIEDGIKTNDNRIYNFEYLQNGEVLIGKWKDGSNYYRNVYNLGNLKNNDTTKIFFTNEDVKEYEVYVSNGQVRYKLPYVRY